MNVDDESSSSDHHDDSLLLEGNQKQSSSSSSSESSIIPEGMLPSYLAEAFGDLYQEDGLVVLGKGLGWLNLLGCFVRFYADVEQGHVALLRQQAQETAANNNKNENSNTPKQQRAPSALEDGTKEEIKPPLVLVLGLKNDAEQRALLTILEFWGTPQEYLPTIINNESGQAKDRAALYQRGGVFCITSRILIVDLLTKTIDSKQIDGLLVAHAENISSESTEAFIIRIYTSQKKGRDQETGFIKCFTDSPAGLLQGFAKIDKTLKALQVRRLYLYPRFHDSVRQELEKHPPLVEELYQDLTPLMKDIQNAILVAVKTCMKELKAATPLLDWTSEELSLENCVTSSFDRAVTRQLEPEWHQLKPQTKQLVHDLKTLRTLFQALIQYDCVSFWKFINSIKSMSAASRHPSLWLLTPAADMLFRKAKERMYTVVHKKKPTAQVPNPVGRLVPKLEENPKWRLLRNLLTEIQQKETEKQPEPKDTPSTILVMAKDERTVETLRSYLVDGRDHTMSRRWLNYLESYNDSKRSIQGTNISAEGRLLFEEESRVKRFVDGKHKEREQRIEDEQKKNKKKRRAGLNHVPDYLKKKRKIATEKGRGESSDDLERNAILQESIETTEHDLDEIQKRAMKEQEDVGDSDSSIDIYDEMFQVSTVQEPRVVLKSFSSIEGDQKGMLLQDMRPNYVILYDTDIAFIRALEIHTALHSTPEEKIHVYFLIFEASAEQKTFMKTLEREKSAFERLIHHKRTMPPPALHVTGTQEMQHELATGTVLDVYDGKSVPTDSRRGRGKLKEDGERRDIAVDVREFRSSLPSILHQGGMRLAPATLTVGDFVLSSVHCVERKSISDLFGSFASGRLYTQAEQMSKYYKCPALLIEFDPSKSFRLQNSNELGSEIRSDAISSKIALLTMHFPKLRILWSKSPHETLRIFKELKRHHDEVDVEKAIEIGRNESEELLLKPETGTAGTDEEDEVNEVARDMLLRLPGVNVHNARRIMRECDSLAELAQMSRDDLRRIAGPVTGQKLFTFFRQTLAST